MAVAMDWAAAGSVAGAQLPTAAAVEVRWVEGVGAALPSRPAGASALVVAARAVGLVEVATAVVGAVATAAADAETVGAVALAAAATVAVGVAVTGAEMAAEDQSSTLCSRSPCLPSESTSTRSYPSGHTCDSSIPSRTLQARARRERVTLSARRARRERERGTRDAARVRMRVSTGRWRRAWRRR